MIVSSACGNGGVATVDSSSPRFINRTTFPDLQVDPIRENEIAEAADWIGKGYHGVPGAGVPDYDGQIISTPSPELDAKVHRIAADMRGIVVETRPEISAAVINATPNCKFCPYKDPTGFIDCSANGHDWTYCEVLVNRLGTSLCLPSIPGTSGPGRS